MHTPFHPGLSRRQLMRGAGLLSTAAVLHTLGLPTARADTDALWNITLPQPNGTPLAMRSLRGSPLLVNFWATWCAPCVQELPMLNQFHKTQQARKEGWKVVGIAIDTPQKVQSFVQRFELDFPILVAGNQGMRLSRELGNPGSLPFTLVVDAKGSIRTHKIGMVHTEDLARWSNGQL